MANVCVDNSFTVTDGVLGVSRCGDAASEAWPFTADPEEANGLRFDEACGLWVAPEKQLLRVQHTHQNAPNQTFGVGVRAGTPLVANLTNPSASLSMLLLLTARVEWYNAQGDGTNGGYGSFECSVTVDNPTPNYIVRQNGWRPMGILAGNVGWISFWCDTFTDVLAPGQTKTYRITPQFRNITAAPFQYLNSTERLDGIGITL